MCVAVLTTPGHMLSREQLRKGWAINSDGGGFAFVDDGEVRIMKGYLEEDAFINAYTHFAEKFAGESPFLIHMRIRTSGTVSAKNCHPFPIKNGALIHNGIMFTPSGERAGTKNDLKSDTRVFAENLYNILELEQVKKAEERILKAVGHSNKIAFLYNNKEYFIMNEGAGQWQNDDKKDIWMSNSSCKLYSTPPMYAGGYKANEV